VMGRTNPPMSTVPANPLSRRESGGTPGEPLRSISRMNTRARRPASGDGGPSGLTKYSRIGESNHGCSGPPPSRSMGAEGGPNSAYGPQPTITGTAAYGLTSGDAVRPAWSGQILSGSVYLSGHALGVGAGITGVSTGVATSGLAITTLLARAAAEPPRLCPAAL